MLYVYVAVKIPVQLNKFAKLILMQDALAPGMNAHHHKT